MTPQLIGLVQVAAFLAAYAFAGMRGVLGALGASLPMSASAAVYIGSIGVPVPTMAVFLTAGFALVVDPRRERAAVGFLRPAMPVLVFALLTAFALVSAVFFPRIMEGVTHVYSLDRSAQGVGSAASRLPLVLLGPSSGNFTQSVYLLSSLLMLAVLVPLFRRSPPDALLTVKVAAISHLLFAVLDLFYSTGLTTLVMDTVRNADYAILENHAIAGLRRVIGATAEASIFGSVGVSLFAFFLFRWSDSRSAVDGVLALALLIFAAASLSSSAILGLALVLPLWLLSRGAEIGRYLNPVAAIGLSAAALALIFGFGALWVSSLGGTVDSVIDNLVYRKLGSSSGIERSEWAMQSLRNFTETGGLGVGLGSSRPNGWPTAVLGQLGIVGAVLWLVFLAVSVFRPLPRATTAEAARIRAAVRPARAMAFAIVFTATLSSPLVDLGYLFMTAAAIAVAARLREPARRTDGYSPQGPSLRLRSPTAGRSL